MTHRILLFLAAVAAAAAQVPGPRTLRLDYVHTGMAAEEQFALDGVVLEGEWPGPLDRLTDESNLGKYYFQVLDRANNRVIYSRGFASIYGEWETTGEAKEKRRAFSERVRFPAPALPVQVVIKKRGPRNEFREVWSTVVDPSDAGVERGAPPKLNVWAVMQKGAPRDKVDLLLMGDGYTVTEMEKWHRDARRMVETLFAASPFKEHRQDFNVWAVDTPAEESGVARPSDGIFRRSPLRAAYDAFGSERYVLTFDNKRLREAASAAPYEFIEIVVNDRKYGGGGIFNLFATVSADNAFTPYVFVHEFGHHFAGLADEYFTSDVAFGSATERVEPWEPNATALLDPATLKWKDLVTPGTPLPTPWVKKAFEDESRAIQKRRRQIRADKLPEEKMDELFVEEKAAESKLLSSNPNAKRVGAFEGSMYESTGYYRPQIDCIMFTRNDVPFCAPCRRALERIID